MKTSAEVKRLQKWLKKKGKPSSIEEALETPVSFLTADNHKQSTPIFSETKFEKYPA